MYRVDFEELLRHLKNNIIGKQMVRCQDMQQENLLKKRFLNF